MSSRDIAIYGATGLVGRLVCNELVGAGVAVTVSGRDRDKLAELQASLPVAVASVATIDDPAALAAAFAGARVVVNCAPTNVTGERVLVAALAAGAHYLDVGSDQASLHAMYERYESKVRRSERVCLLGTGLECTVGDLAASWAAAHLCGAESSGEFMRSAAAERLADDRPFDDIAVSYIFDDLVLSPSSQRALFDGLHRRGVMWQRDRWEAVAPAAQHRRINAGLAMGGEREVLSFPGGDVITIPRHIASRTVQTFISTSRHAATTTALRLLVRAIPVVSKRISEVLAPYVPERDEYIRTRFAIVASARRGNSSAHVTVRGSDLYRTSAAVAAWIARQLIARARGPVGMLAASELFHAQPALQQLAVAANVTVEASFG